MVALTVFLQADAAWWKGLATATGLFAIGGLAVMINPDQSGSPLTVLEATPTITIWACAILVAFGSVLALALRPFFSAGKMAGSVFGFAVVGLTIFTLFFGGA